MSEGQLTTEDVIRLLEQTDLEQTEDGRVYTTRKINGAPVWGIAATGSGFYDNAGPKHVLMVSAYGCIRVSKTAEALRQKGYRVDIISMRVPRLEAYDYSIVTSLERYPDLIAASGASIIHVHNEPDSLVVYAQLGSRGRPVVYDCHDLEAHRFGEPTESEFHAFATADGIVNVGERYRQVAWDLHPWTAPDIVVRSLPVKAWVPTTSDEGRQGIVLQGGAEFPGGENAWRDYSGVVAQLAARGWPLHMYIRDDLKEDYESLGAIVHGWHDYPDMLKELGKYSFGFVGLHERHHKLDDASPNKLNEYASCGAIPAICNMPGLAAEFGAEGCVSADSIDALVDAMEAADTARKREAARASVVWMDDEVDKTIALYESLL